MINVLITCFVCVALSNKKKKRLLLSIHYVYLSLAGGGSVVRMDSFVDSGMHTMALFMLQSGPLSLTEVLLSVTHEMLLVLLMGLTFRG